MVLNFKNASFLTAFLSICLITINNELKIFILCIIFNVFRVFFIVVKNSG